MEYEKYFGHDRVKEYKLEHPCKRSTWIGELRKKGDSVNQYVTNVYYCDTLITSFDETEIYSSYQDDDEYSPVYSDLHSECDYCREHKEKVKQNWIVGFKVYPPNMIPDKTYAQRKKEWEKFR